MKVTTKLTISHGTPDPRAPGSIDLINRALPHGVNISYTPGDKDGHLYIKVGSASVMTGSGPSTMTGSISKKAAHNLLEALIAWRDGVYE